VVQVRRNEKILVLKEREVLEVLGTIENLVRHVKTLLRDIKYLEVNS
jgi:hypothetical protein